MLKGIGVSEGIGIGKALVIESHDIKFDSYAIRSINEELERYHKAVEKFIIRTKEMANNIATNASEKEAEFFWSYNNGQRPLYAGRNRKPYKKWSMCRIRSF